MGGNAVERADSYFNNIIQDNQIRELNKKLTLVWAIYGKLRGIFKSDISVYVKLKHFVHQYMLPVIPYGFETI